MILKWVFKMINQKKLALELNEIYVEYYNDFFNSGTIRIL